MNLFQPSVKLMKTVRRGSRVKKEYSAPQTPLDRLAKWDKRLAAELLKLRDNLDPFTLAAEVNHRLEGIWKTANFRPKLKEIAKPKEDLVEEAVRLISRRLDVQNQAREDGRHRIPAMV